MNKRITHLSILMAMLLFALGSCNKYDPSKIASAAWNPNLAVPLAHGHFTVYDILARTDSNDVVIIDDNTGAIALVYKGEVVSYEGEDLIDLNDYTESVSLSNTDYSLAASGSFSGSTSGSDVTTVAPSLNAGVELYTVEFSAGTLSIDMSTDLQHDIDVTITIPELYEGGVPLTRTATLTYGGTVPQTATITVDLTGTFLDLTKGGTTFNEFDVQTNVTISGTGQPVTGTESFSADYGFSNMTFAKATGYFGQQSIVVDQDSIKLKIFDSEPDGYFELVDPKIRFIVTNSFGIPVEISLNNLQSIDVTNGTTFNLSGYPNPLIVNAPTTIGDTAITTLELNTSNTTNLTSVITPTPKWFYFETAGLTNPAGNVAPNFVMDTSRLVVDAEVEMPLEGFAYGFTVSDTTEFSFNENVDNIESLMFRINVDNGFPVELLGQVTLLDSNHIPLFTLLDAPENVIESAPVDANGRVTSSNQKITDVTLDKAQIEQMNQVAFVVVSGEAQSLQGTSGKIVKLFEDYTIDLKIGMKVQGSFKL